MILVHVKSTWPQVLAGKMTADDSVLGDWHGIAEAKLAEFGDVLAGVYNNTVVAVYDIDLSNTRYVDGKVRFAGTPSKSWSHLVGQPNPRKPWGAQGYARSVQYVDTALVAGGDVPVQHTHSGRRAVVDGFTLTIGPDGHGTVFLPIDRTLTVQPVPYPAQWVIDSLPALDNDIDQPTPVAHLRDGHATNVGSDAHHTAQKPAKESDTTAAVRPPRPKGPVPL